MDHEKELVEALTDADWAGDKSTPARRRRSVSSALIFVDNRLVTSWSRTQKSIALSSCESEYLSAVGGGAESLYVASWPGRKWWQESLQILQVAEPLRNGKA